MSESLSPFVIVEVQAAQREWSYWLCAAALEPALPTWVGPAWGELLARQAGSEPTALPVTLTRDLYTQLTAEDCPSAIPTIVQHFLTEQAVEVLRRHGIQPIRETSPCQLNDHIPF